MSRSHQKVDARYIGLIVVLALALTPSVSFAGTTYYVDCSAGSNGDGSYSSPWNNIDSIHANDFSLGDDVYFRVGTTCDVASGSYIYISWNGAVDDPVVIGAYYGENLFGLSGGDRPILDEGEDCIDEDSCSNQWSGLINARAGSDGYGNLTIENLEIRNTSAIGIQVGDYDNVIIYNNLTYNTGSQGVILARSAYSEMANNETSRHSRRTDRAGASVEVTSTGGWNSDPPECHDITIEYNVVHSGNSHEGLGIYTGCHDIVVQHNVIYDHGTYYLYLSDVYDIIARYNLIYKSEAATRSGAAIVLGPECANSAGHCLRDDGSGNEIYGNLIAGSFGRGIRITNPDPSYPNCPVPCLESGSVIANNTFVDNVKSISVMGQGDGAGNVIANNISLLYSSGAVHVDAENPSGFLWDSNLWYGVDTVGGNAANNAVTEDPLLSRTSGWRAMEPGGCDGSDFALQEGSPAIDAGLALDAEYSMDYFGTSRPQGSAWDIGAHEYLEPGATCSDLGGSCCGSGERCEGGIFIESPDCGTQCCSGGSCQLDDLLLRAARARGPMVVDGQIEEAEWTETSSITFTDPSGASDNTTVVRALWDNEAVYFGFEITDDDLRTGGDDVWQDDGVELFIDTALDRGSSRQPDDIQVIVNTIGRTVFVHDENRVLPETVTFGAWTVEEGYTIEIRLTWEEIGREPATGLTMGLDLVNNDRDEDEIRHPYDWANLDVFHFPDGWGLLELTGDDGPGVDGGADGDADADADAGEIGDADINTNDGSAGDLQGGCECATAMSRTPRNTMMLLLSFLALACLATLRQSRR